MIANLDIRSRLPDLDVPTDTQTARQS
jgi:hypothetical protein